jgi:type I restriction enzyme S subunit
MNPEAAPLLLDVCEFIVDCLHATAPIQDEGYPLIRTPNVGRGRLELEGVYRVSEQTYEKWTRRAVPMSGDLVLAREAPAGNVALVKNGQTVCLGQRTVHLRPDSLKVDPQYLCYFLLAPRQQGLLLAGETGATAKHVNMKDIRRLPLNGLPPLPTQKKAGAIVAQYDDLLENNRRRIQLLEQAALLLFREWFVHFRFPGHSHLRVTHGVPEGWQKTTLGAYAPLTYGKALRDDLRIEGKVPVYGSSGKVGVHNIPLVQGRGIIVGRKGNVGAVHYCEVPFWPIDTTYFIEGSAASRFLYFTLSRIGFRNTDGAVPGLNRDFAHSRELLVPPEPLLISFEEEVAPLYALARKLTRQSECLIQARDLLLPRLMNGEVAV